MTDPQTRIFRDATADQWQESALVDHPDATLDDLEPGVRRSVDEHEADGWDSERAGPKTLDMARENLAARIADPDAPDGPAEFGAYDDLEGA